MFPNRIFAGRYFPTRYFPKTGAVLVTTGAWALWIPLGLKGLPQATKPGSAVVNVGTALAVSQKSGSASNVVPRGSGVARVEQKGSGRK
jgi:hypothetical protein